MGSPLDLSLVLACYNEEVVFESSMVEILKVLDGMRLEYEIIFVDDCSRDNTRELIDRFILNHPSHRLSRIFHDKNIGRGGTVADGFYEAKGEIVGYIDIDLEVHCRFIRHCVAAIEKGAHVAIAKRLYRFQWRNIGRYILSRGYRCLSCGLLGLPALDTETGYKFFRRDAILPLLREIKDKHWFWDTEVMARSFYKGYRIKEIPCPFHRRFDKRSTLQAVPDTIDYFFKLLRFRKELGPLHLRAFSTEPVWKKSRSSA